MPTRSSLGEGKLGSEKKNPIAERSSKNADDERIQLLNYLKSKPIRGDNECLLYEELGRTLKIETERIKKIVETLLREGLIMKSTFTIYSPTSKTSSSGFAINATTKETKKHRPGHGAQRHDYVIRNTRHEIRKRDAERIRRAGMYTDRASTY